MLARASVTLGKKCTQQKPQCEHKATILRAALCSCFRLALLKNTKGGDCLKRTVGFQRVCATNGESPLALPFKPSKRELRTLTVDLEPRVTHIQNGPAGVL